MRTVISWLTVIMEQQVCTICRSRQLCTHFVTGWHTACKHFFKKFHVHAY